MTVLVAEGERNTIARASVSMSSPPHAFVQSVISWLTQLSQLTLHDLDLESRIRIAVTELTENVIKYGRAGSARVDIALEQRSREVFLRIETTNSAPQKDIQRAVGLLDDLRAADDPIAYYDQLILSVAPVREPGVSGLGLARIRAEGELELDYRVEGDALTIAVEAPIGALEAA